MRRRIVAGLLALVLFVLSGCANTGNGTTADGIEKDELVTVKIYDPLNSTIGITTGYADIIVHANSAFFEYALYEEDPYY